MTNGDAMDQALVDRLKIEYRPLARLIPYAKNARTHSDAQVAEIAASIRAFGWTNPVLVDGEDGVIAGHGRLLAARKLGMTEVPVIELAGMSEAEKQAYIIADNKLALNAGWDKDLLALELADLDARRLRPVADRLRRRRTRGAAELRQRGADRSRCDPGGPGRSGYPAGRRLDPGPAPAGLWRRDQCRMTSPSVLGGVVPHLMVTDPPYGVNYDPAWREDAGLTEGSTVAKGKVLNDDRADWREAWALFPGDVAYVWHGGLHAGTVAQSLEASGFAIRSQIIWDKTRLVIGRGDYHWSHEPAYYSVRKGKTGHWAGDRSQTTVWSIPHRKNDTGHGTEKPVECMKRPIENNSSPGQAVYEPFSGSGTTIIAAEMTGRSCHAIELNPAYVDVAIRRWQEFTGEEAVLDGDGRTFAEIEVERGAEVEATGDKTGAASLRVPGEA